MSELNWRTASYSANGSACVEVADTAERHFVRDTKNRAGATLAFGPAQWSAFVAAVRQPRD